MNVNLYFVINGSGTKNVILHLLIKHHFIENVKAYLEINVRL